MERDKIIRVLEWLEWLKSNTRYSDEAEIELTISLINELTEENEQWRNDWERNQSQWEEAYEKLESDTVRKFADYLKKQSFMCDPGNGFSFDAIDADELDNYVKEFLED